MVVLHLTGTFLPARVGIWVAVSLAVVALAVSVVRERSEWFVPLRSVGAWGVSLAVGVPGAILALAPSLLAGSPQLVSATVSNDGFYYASVVDWLTGHPVLALPNIGANPLLGLDSPAYGPAAESLRSGLRVGQELVQAGLGSLTGLGPVSAFSPWIGLWVLLVPGGLWVLGEVFHVARIGRVILGLVVVTSFSLVDQVLRQNADSLLGIAFLGLVIALVAAGVSAPRKERVTPLWLAALVVAALVGTYTEYLPFAGVTLVMVVLLRAPRAVPRALARALVIIGLSIVLGPLIWARAIQNSLFVGGIAAGGGGTTLSFGEGVGRLLGPYQAIFEPNGVVTYGHTGQVLLTLVVLAILAGCVLALIGRRSRPLAVGAALSAAIIVYIAFKGNDYVTSRGAAIVTPLVFTAAVLGWVNLYRWARRSQRSTTDPTARSNSRRGRSLAVLVAGAAAAAVTVGIGVNFAFVNTVDARSDDVLVSAEFHEAASWVSRIGNGDGSAVAVASATLFQQLWISEALSSAPDVSYISLRGDLGYRGNLTMHTFWADQPERYVLLGRGAFGSYDPSAVVEQNSQFVLLDLTKPATVAVPVVAAPSWSYVTDASGAISSSAAGVVQLLTSEQSLAGLSLQVRGLAPGSTVTLEQNGSPVASIDAAGEALKLPLTGVTVQNSLAQVTIAVTTQSAPGAGTAVAPTSRSGDLFALEGITRD
ncbi:hypothetical protein [Subtercola sp. RTI3]|uniref:hypothetical protein n=1 Tax=Subtercola sp. RTI3 TaxID=3048639 RepID=UPI002B22D212|nr:hypothetical protein [Subtercola sp. RTI3]MEA9984427.1 hypothetical protein [Subtercola sp. RTI3]